jgi:hydrogenase nickel incorporation protein HypA/HybF
MHEVSLVREMLMQVRHAMCVHEVTRVSAIHIEIGPLAGVDPVLVQEAFQRLAVSWDLGSARLAVDEPPLVAQCDDCHRPFEVIDFDFHCTRCGSTQVQVTSGDQMRLLDITASTS